MVKYKMIKLSKLIDKMTNDETMAKAYYKLNQLSYRTKYIQVLIRFYLTLLFIFHFELYLDGNLVNS